MSARSAARRSSASLHGRIFQRQWAGLSLHPSAPIFGAISARSGMVATADFVSAPCREMTEKEPVREQQRICVMRSDPLSIAEAVHVAAQDDRPHEELLMVARFFETLILKANALEPTPTQVR